MIIKTKKKSETDWAGDLFDKAVDADFDPSVVDNIKDDTWLEKPRSSFHFLTSRKFLGIDPFPVQAKIITEFFEDFCTHCTDIHFWNRIRVDTPDRKSVV